MTLHFGMFGVRQTKSTSSCMSGTLPSNDGPVRLVGVQARSETPPSPTSPQKKTSTTTLLQDKKDRLALKLNQASPTPSTSSSAMQRIPSVRLTCEDQALLKQTFSVPIPTTRSGDDGNAQEQENNESSGSSLSLRQGLATLRRSTSRLYSRIPWRVRHPLATRAEIAARKEARVKTLLHIGTDYLPIKFLATSKATTTTTTNPKSSQSLNNKSSKGITSVDTVVYMKLRLTGLLLSDVPSYTSLTRSHSARSLALEQLCQTLTSAKKKNMDKSDRLRSFLNRFDSTREDNQQQQQQTSQTKSRKPKPRKLEVLIPWSLVEVVHVQAELTLEIVLDPMKKDQWRRLSWWPAVMPTDGRLWVRFFNLLDLRSFALAGFTGQCLDNEVIRRKVLGSL